MLSHGGERASAWGGGSVEGRKERGLGDKRVCPGKNNVNVSGYAQSKGEQKPVDTKTAGWGHRAGGAHDLMGESRKSVMKSPLYGERCECG